MSGATAAQVSLPKLAASATSVVASPSKKRETGPSDVSWDGK